MSIAMRSDRTGGDTSSTPAVAAAGRKFGRLGLVIGAMKAGTTSLFHALSEHPQIAPSSTKETHFFRSDQTAQGGLDAYEAYWTFDPARHVVALEASTSYSEFGRYPGVPKRLAATPYDLRLVYVLRNPIARYSSHYIHAVDRDYPIEDIRHKIDPHALAASSYAAQLRAYTAHIPREKILLVRFEDLTSNPLPQLNRIADHFGVARAAFPGLVHAHSTARHHLKGALERLTEEGAKADGKFDPPSFTTSGQIDLRQTFLPPERVRDLHAALRDDMRRLHEEWGFDVKPWGF